MTTRSRAGLLALALSSALALGCASVVTGQEVQSAAGATATAVSQASPQPTATPTTATPTAPVSAIFNDPWSTKRSKQYRITTAQLRLIKATKRGAVITLMTYSISDTDVAKALIAAKKRGVAVRVLVDDHSKYKATKTLRAKLGTNKRAKSYVARCYLACASDVTYPDKIHDTTTRPYQHAKALAVSKAGSDRYVVVIPSGNLTSAAASTQANEAIVVKGDKAVYDFVVGRFTRMIRDNGGTAATISSGTVTLRQYPEVPKKVILEPKPTDDPYAALLDDITCVKDGTATRIDIAMYMWSFPRAYLATRLAKLSASGCDVRVVGPITKKGQDGKIWDPQVVKALRSGGDIELWQVDPKRVLHSKYVVIDGWDADGNRLRSVSAGSPNFLLQALFYSDELAVATTDESVVDAYQADFEHLLADHSKQVSR
mgnify:CR=1 FL=1